MMLGLIFFNTAISSISLTINVSFNTLQPPEFGKQFLLGCVLLRHISISSLSRIMNFYCILLRNYKIRQWYKNVPKGVSLLLHTLGKKNFPIESTRK